jgi:Uncharacterized conserved protein (DUF2304)
MSNVAIQSLLVALGGLGLLTGVFLLARRGQLSLRYALGWMAVSVLVVVAAIVLVLIGGISHSLPLTPTGLLASVGLAFLLVISLQLSISLSGQREAIRELSEANALLAERLGRIEEHVRSGERRQEDDTDAPSSARSSQGGSSLGPG